MITEVKEAPRTCASCAHRRGFNWQWCAQTGEDLGGYLTSPKWQTHTCAGWEDKFAEKRP